MAIDCELEGCPDNDSHGKCKDDRVLSCFNRSRGYLPANEEAEDNTEEG